jgi:hypothetical protein
MTKVEIACGILKPGIGKAIERARIKINTPSRRFANGVVAHFHLGFATLSAFSRKGRIAWMAAAKALRGTVFLSMNFGSRICLWPTAIWAEMTAVGITTIAAKPGTGIGTTSGIAKNMSEVPKELSPIELTIFSTVNSMTSGLFAKMSRRICDVRVFSGEIVFLADVRGLLRVVVVFAAVEDTFRAADFVGGLRASLFFNLTPDSAKTVRVTAADALIGF